MVKSGKFKCEDFSRENMPVQLLLAQVGHMYKWYVGNLMKDTQMKPGQAGILVILQMMGPMSQRELADRVHITPPSVNVDVQKLEKLGYVRKEQDEKDQRMTKIHLTDSGEKTIENMHDIIQRTEDTLLKNMSTEEKILCRRLLLQMSDNLFQEKAFREMPCKSPFEQ